jgi:ABC-2 type transport system permease protein
VLLGGIFWPVETLPDLLQPISRLMPMTYLVEGLRAVMTRGAGLGDQVVQVAVVFLAGAAVVFAGLATRTIRREVA